MEARAVAVLLMLHSTMISVSYASGEDLPATIRLKVAVVCMNAQTDKEVNLDTFASYMAQAAEQGAHLIVFPEIALQQNPGWGPSSYHPTEDEQAYVRDTAETIPGPSTDIIVALARSHRICVVFGMTEDGSDGNFYNASVLIGPLGVLGSYRKNRLWDASTLGNEHLFWSRGDNAGSVVQSPLGNVGLMICIEMYHNFGPGLAMEGADFLATVSAWPADSGGQYETSTTSNARTADRWHFVANQTGPVGHSTDYGHSRTINPNGEIVADTGSTEGMVLVETDILIPAPIVDFNGDGNVDGADVLILAARWGQADPACDIAPVPFHDGMVDVEDLKVLASYIGKEVNDPTLIACWTLNEAEGTIASDSVGGNDATFTDEPVWWPDAGAVGGALELDGTTFATTNPVLDPAEGPFSVLAWVKSGEPGQVILSQVGGTNWLMADPSEGALMTELSPPAGRQKIPPLGSSAVITDGDWHRIMIVWDGATRAMYVDETLVAEDVQTGLAACGGGLNLGCDKDMTPGTFWSGLLDDVRIYNRVVQP